MTGRVVVGLDIGGTKTHVRVAPVDGGDPVADAVEASGGWSAEPVAAAADWIMRVVRRHVPAGTTVAAIGAGAQGCDTAEHCAALSRELTAAAGVPATVTNDAALLVPAAGLEQGIGVIAGTGSIAVAVRPDGGLDFAGGWGWVIGDEGSAPALVREAVRAALTRHDAGGEPDVLLPALLDAFGVSGPTGLARTVNDNTDPGHWAARAPAVFAAAAAGSADARRVVEAGGASLAALVGVLVGKGASGDVVAAGGVMTSQPSLFAAFRDRVPAHLTVHLLDAPPVAGAVALAVPRS